MKTDVMVDIDTLISECQELCVIIDGLKNTQLKDDNIAFVRDFNKKYEGYRFDEIISHAAEKRIEHLAAITKKINRVFDKKVIRVATLEKEHELNRDTDKMKFAYDKYQHKYKFVESLSPKVTDEDINECIKYRKEYKDACKERNAILHYCNYHSFEKTLYVCKKINAQCDIYLTDKSNIIKNDNLDVCLVKTQEEKELSQEKMNSEKKNNFIYIDNSQTFIKKEGDKVNNDNRKTFIKKEEDKVYNQTLNYDKITNNYPSNKSKDEVPSDKNAGKEKSNANASYNCNEKAKKNDKDKLYDIAYDLFHILCSNGPLGVFNCNDKNDLYQYLLNKDDYDYSKFVKKKQKGYLAIRSISECLTDKDWFDKMRKRLGNTISDKNHNSDSETTKLFDPYR